MRIPPEIKYEYSRRRQRALRERDERVAEAYAAVPRLSALAAERAELIFRQGAAKLDGDAAEQRRLALAVAALDAEQTALLNAQGFPEDMLEPRWSCEECKDTGYTGFPVRQMCACLRTRLIQAQSAASNTDPAQRFENFRLDIYKDERQKRLSQKAMEYCLRYADDFPDMRVKNLLIRGKSGLGKTYLLNCIANRVSARGYAVQQLTAYNYIDEVLKAIRENEAKPDPLLSELMLLDDLGAESMIPNITVEQLFALINDRQCRGLATVFATNLDMQQLQELYGERVFTRLVQPRVTDVILLEGDNLRLI